MDKFRTLTKVLFKNNSLSGRSNTRNKIAVLIVSIAVIFLLFAQGVSLWNAYNTIASHNLIEVTLGSLFTATSITMVVLGIFYVISTYYFSDDIMLLLTMPIPPHRILAAKFCVVMLFEYGIEVLISLPSLVVFGIRGGNFFYWVNAVLVFAALPLLPMVICSVISILIMSFSRFFKNKDRVKFLAGLVSIILILGISIPIQMFDGHMTSSQMIQSSSALMQKTVELFPSNFLAVRAILSGTVVSFLWLGAFLLLSAIAVAAFLLLGNRFYLGGVIGLTQSNVQRKNLRGSFQTNRRPAFLAIALKDWRLLCRTPAFALNCLLGAFLVPVILGVTFVFSLKGIVFPQANALVISIGVLFLTFTSMMNVISPTAVSRDGQNASLARMVPVRFEVQIFGKLLPGLAMSFVAMILTAVPICIFFRLDSNMVIEICGLSAIALITFNMIGLFVDIVFPKLDWDDETVAIKRNFNVSIELLLMLIFLGLPIFLIYKLQLDLKSGMAFLLIYNLILLFASALLLLRKGSEFYSSDLHEKSAKKAAANQKNIGMAIGAIVTVAVFALMGWEFFFVHTDVKIASSQVSVSAGLGESSSFDLAQIQKIYLKDTLPPVSGKVGFEAGSQLRGSFNVEGMGRGHVYTQSAKGPFLFVILKDGTFTVFNFNDTSETNSLYNSLKKYSK